MVRCAESCFRPSLSVSCFLLPSFLSSRKKKACNYHESILSIPFTIFGPSLLPHSLRISPKARPLGVVRESGRLPCIAPLNPYAPSLPPKFGCIRDRQFMRKCYDLERHSSWR
ncbi:hypothetical protein E2C01_013205 [Portunus trituberculatus]|uniref:Uncharacterized protein n=1 Tax=Portunus trituberculatus TaxID=210409 RepID=A0A5B7DGG8_PORTR|nr:hypothetical protein [Portunus trituberculatus]